MARYLVACDAGGTMTDVIVVDEEGRSVIGKAPTTPLRRERRVHGVARGGAPLHGTGHGAGWPEVLPAASRRPSTPAPSMLNALINLIGSQDRA